MPTCLHLKTIRSPYGKVSTLITEKFLSSNFISITTRHSLRHCLEAFLKHRADVACVVDADGKLEGIVTKYTIYRALLSGASIDSPVTSAVRTRVVSLSRETTITEARKILTENNVAHGIVLDEQQRPVGVLGKADIIRAFLQKTELILNRHTVLIEHLQDAVVSVDAEHRIITYNRAAETLFGMPRKDIIGKTLADTLPELSRDFSLTIEQGSVRESKKIVLKNSTVIGSFIPLREWGTITGAMAVLKDMTSYEQVAKELETTKKLERTLQSALSMSYDGVLITDERGVVTMANAAFLELYGLEYEAVVGRPATDIAPELPIQQVLLRKERIEGEIRELAGKKCIVILHPIIQSGRLEGVIAKLIFHRLDQWKDVFRRLEQLESELTYYRGELNRIAQENPFDQIVSQSSKMNTVKNEAYLAAKGFSTILITGESGTGKELFAEAIHEASGRTGKYIKVNCAAIPSELLEAEFFGYVDGAFTGARKGGKPGKFELAHRGTLFLDEIGDMPLALQAKLLRVLQEQQFERIGDTKTRTVDVRIVAATNKNLRQLVKEGKFREDLYYRINVIQITIPPLRERLDDIPLLCEHFIKKLNQKMNKKVIGITPETLRLLQAHSWPGNVRELENVLERAMHFGSGAWIEPEHLPAEFHTLPFAGPAKEKGTAEDTASPGFSQAASSEPSTEEMVNHRDLLAHVEKQAILEALERAGGNRSLAAQKLGISRTALYKKLKKYNIQGVIHFHSN
mgnify:CR=1 FL=1